MAGLEQRSKWCVHLDALIRYKAWRFAGTQSPYVFVAEYPKAGGSWFCQMLAECLELPFLRNTSLPLFRPKPAILHGHFLWRPGMPRAVCVLRDGRDIAVSSYHYLLFHLEDTSLGRKVRSDLAMNDPHDIRANLPDFLEYLFDAPPLGGRRFQWQRANWAKFVESWHGTDAHVVRYEDLLIDGPGTLDTCLQEMFGIRIPRSRLEQIVERFSFARQTARQPGQEDRKNFLRKGIAGDWRQQFSTNARRTFDRLAGDALILAGYEPDRAWVEQVQDCPTLAAPRAA